MDQMENRIFRPEKCHKKGMELCREFYETYGKPMIREQFAEYESRIAVGMVGEGSDCFGFDDVCSEDHDFGAAFCMWLLPEDETRIGRQLQEAYDRLPDSFAGYPVRKDNRMTGHRIGVWGIGSFYERFLGCGGVPDNLKHWLRIPESYLAVCTNGTVFRDDAGCFTAVREKLLAGYPEDVRIKKMTAHAAIMSQSGQYNYPRCQNRGEGVAAELALAEFIRSAIPMIYLLNHQYAPYYKWMHRGMERLSVLSDTKELFTRLVSQNTFPQEKQELIEEICRKTAAELRSQRLISSDDPFLQLHLDEMMRHIQDPEIRNMHWLEGV